jgi:hypothetical protein
VTGADREKQTVSGAHGAADWTVVLRARTAAAPWLSSPGACGSNLSKTARQGDARAAASKLPPESWLSPWRPMGPGEVACDVDRYNLPHDEELAAVLIYVPGEERPIDAGTL